MESSRCTRGRTFICFIACVAVTAACGKNNGTSVSNGANAGSMDAGMDAADETDSGGESDVSGDQGGDEDDASGEDDTGADVGPDMSEEGYSDPAGASGTRLRRMYFDSGGGAYMTVQFWDTELEAPCTFGEAADGALRCLPTQNTSVVFTDSGCTNAAYNRDQEECGLGWARLYQDNSYYRSTGDAATFDDGVVYVRDDGECRESGYDVDDEYLVAEEVPSAEFVRGTRMDESRAGDLTARFVEGEDGSRAFLEARHASMDYRCFFDGEGRCVASQSYSTQYFEDAACQDPIYGGFGDETPLMIRVEQQAANGCVTGWEPHEVGELVTPATVYYRTDEGCDSFSPEPDRRFYRAGPLLDLPEANLELEGDGRVVGRRYVDDDGEPLGSVHEFWDTSTDEPCDPTILPDGTFACLTRDRGYASEALYLDAACAEPLEMGIASCNASTPQLLEQENPEEVCRPLGVRATRAVWEPAEEVGPDFYVDNDFADCELMTLEDHETGYRLGAEVTDALPVLEWKTE